MTDFTPSATEQGVPAQTNGASVKRANLSQIPGLPEAQGLYDPRNEHDLLRHRWRKVRHLHVLRSLPQRVFHGRVRFSGGCPRA